MHEYLVPSPRHVEADVVTALKDFDIKASTLVPKDLRSGTVRISRTGGPLDRHQTRDLPEVLIEVWDESPTTSFQTARRVWAAFRAIGSRGWIRPGVSCTNVQCDPPRAYDDEQAPNLYRMQFVVSMLMPLEDVTITDSQETR